jgi:FkbM family methyltransferase
MRGVSARVQLRTPVGDLEIVGSDDDHVIIGGLRRDAGVYEPEVLDLLSKLVQPTDVCLDVGANIGVITLPLARFARDGHVYSFEPGRQSVAYLKQNVLEHHLDNVTVEARGVSSETKTLRLYVDAGHPGGSHVGGTSEQNETFEEIDVVALDDWARTNSIGRIDVVKMDIEGSELNALRGATEVLRRDRPLFILECNPTALGLYQGATADDLWAMLVEIYGRVFFISDGPVRQVLSKRDLRRALERFGIIDLVCGDRAAAIAELRVRTIAKRTAQAAKRKLIRRPPRANFAIEPEYEIVLPVSRLELSPDATTTLPVRLRNLGTIWFSSALSPHPITLSYRVVAADGAPVVQDGLRTFLWDPVGPGARATVDMLIAAPSAAGRFVVQVALVQEGFAWFDRLNPSLAASLELVVS